MDSDDEIFLTQNTFSQEPFSPELDLEELVGDFREVSERDSVEVEKKKILGVVSLLFVITKSRREESPEYRQTRKLILLGQYVAGRNGPSNAM